MGDDELSSIEVNCIVAAMFIMEAPFYALPNPACAVSSENNEVRIHSDARNNHQKDIACVSKMSSPVTHQSCQERDLREVQHRAPSPG